MDAPNHSVIVPTAAPPTRFKPLPSGRWLQTEYLPPPITSRVRTMEQRLEELTQHLCGLRGMAERMVRLHAGCEELGPSLAQWKLVAERLGELLTLLELPLQLRDDLPVSDPASDPATGLPADGPWQQLPLADVNGIPKRALKSRAAGKLTTLGQLVDCLVLAPPPPPLKGLWS